MDQHYKVVQLPLQPGLPAGGPPSSGLKVYCPEINLLDAVNFKTRKWISITFNFNYLCSLGSLLGTPLLLA